MSTIDDLWKAYLTGEGYTFSSVQDTIRQALLSETGRSTGSIQELWKAYLEAEGYDGAVPDMMKKWLAAKGYDGAVQDMLKKALRDGDIFAAAAAACAYALDDDGTLAALFGFAHLPTDAPAYQSYSYVLTGSATGGTAVALNNDAVGAGAISKGTDIKCFEWECTQFPTGDYVGQGPAVVWGGGAGALAFGLRRSGGVVQVYTDNGATVVNVAGGVAVGTRIGVYINGTTGQMGWVLDGVDQGLTGADLSAAASFSPYCFVNDGNPEPVGQTCGGVLVTDNLTAAEFPVGGVTICGEPL